MSCVMRCPACMEEVRRGKWSKAQWENWDPWREGRNCCTDCQKKKDGGNTWRTDGKLHMTKAEYRLYARDLREGWEQPQQRSQGSRSRGSKRSWSRSPRRALPSPTYSIWTPPWQQEAAASSEATPLAIDAAATPNSASNVSCTDSVPVLGGYPGPTPENTRPRSSQWMPQSRQTLQTSSLAPSLCQSWEAIHPGPTPENTEVNARQRAQRR